MKDLQYMFCNGVMFLYAFRMLIYINNIVYLFCRRFAYVKQVILLEYVTTGVCFINELASMLVHDEHIFYDNLI